MTLLRQLLWVALMLLLLAVGGLLGLRYHDGFRDALLVEILKPYGVTSIQTRIRSLRLSTAELSELAVSYDQQGIGVSAQLTDLALARAHEMASITDPLSWKILIGDARIQLTTAANSNSGQGDPAEPFYLPTLLPHSILRRVPVDAVKLQHVTLDYRPDNDVSWFFDGDVSASAVEITSQFTLLHAEQVFRGELLLNPEQVELALGDPSLTAEYPYWIRVQSRLDLLDGRLVAGGTLSVADLTHTEDWLALIPADLPLTDNWRGSLNLAFSFIVPEATLQTWLAGDMSQRDGLTITTSIKHDLSFDLPGTQWRDADARGSATVQVSADKLRIQDWQLEKSGLTMNVDDPRVQEAMAPVLGKVDALRFRASGDFQVSAALNGEEVSVVSDKARIRLQSSADDNRQAEFQTFNQLTMDRLSLAMLEKQLDKAVALGKFTLSLPDKPPLKGVAHVAAETSVPGKINGTADLTLEDLTRFTMEYDYSPETEALAFTLNSAKTNLATTTFNEWAEKLALPFQLELGDFSMAMQGEMAINDLQKLSTKGTVLVSDWSGNLEKNHFESLTSPFAFSGDLSHFSLSGEVSNGLFDVGIPITDIRYDIKLESDLPVSHFQISVTDLESRLVGGLVRIPRFAWDNTIRDTRFNVVIFHWQFAEIIGLLQREDLEVSGILDGMLPIHVSEKGWAIRDGRLTARAPGGVIRYKPDPSMKAYLSNQQQLKMAVDILENFEYDTLDAIVNQELDGTQFINLTLKGRNPDAYGGTPVNLNLNIEHNINPLMQSLTLPGEIQENWNKLDTIQQ